MMTVAPCSGLPGPLFSDLSFPLLDDSIELYSTEEAQFNAARALSL